VSNSSAQLRVLHPMPDVGPIGYNVDRLRQERGLSWNRLSAELGKAAGRYRRLACHGWPRVSTRIGVRT
jgi:hypothetical protein